MSADTDPQFVALNPKFSKLVHTTDKKLVLDKFTFYAPIKMNRSRLRVNIVSQMVTRAGKTLTAIRASSLNPSFICYLFAISLMKSPVKCA